MGQSWLKTTIHTGLYFANSKLILDRDRCAPPMIISGMMNRILLGSMIAIFFPPHHKTEYPPHLFYIIGLIPLFIRVILYALFLNFLFTQKRNLGKVFRREVMIE